MIDKYSPEYLKELEDLGLEGFKSEKHEKRYTTYLIIVALLGWALAAYDTNLYNLTIADITAELNISASSLGILGMFVYAAEFLIALAMGYYMDARGRRKAWMLCLCMAGLFTGLTFFVNGFWTLVLVRSLASGFANAELAVSVTLVNEQVPAKRRGMLYSIVQSGYTVGVFLASGMYLMVNGLGWRMVFLFGVIPLILVGIAREKVRESPRFLHMKAMEKAQAAGDEETIKRLQKIMPMDIEANEDGKFIQLFSKAGGVLRTTLSLSTTWILYGMSYVATNIYLTYWMVHVKGWESSEVATLLLAGGGVGVLFYIFGGLLGEKFGRRNVLLGSAAFIAPLSLIILYSDPHPILLICIFLLFQATNGTWSGVGYTYQAEVFPTRVRALGVSWMAGMLVLGFTLGSFLWALLTSSISLENTWLIIAVFLGGAQAISCLFLPKVKPGQELEQIAI
ncbi:MFS transporter [Arcanobacterium urinimassiliense]|uniref:MFS transporter n=1 Tax=Arcanobacterium urinimassiliense TaxID=1871014 RepID=UPI00093C5322|nr:MFS transporter [Arcanobacterium urinimassiliense]